MKQLLTLVAAVVLSATGAWAQCTPNAATGNPGISPPTDSLACIEIGRPYSQVIQIENFDTYNLAIGSATVQSLRIDSITNIPCGLTYQVNPANATFGPGETGCILLSGTSFENVGQYRLNIYVDVQVLLTTPFGSTTLPYNGEAASVVADIENATGQSLGVDFNYFLRVIEANDPCPAIDRTTPGVNLTASASCAPPVFTATISGNTEVCDGQTTTLTVSLTNGVQPYTISWSNGSIGASITNVGPGSYGVTATDSNSEIATATVTVSALTLPTADFTVTAGTNPGEVVITNNSSSATSYFWNFNEEGFDTATTPSFTFAENGTYDVTLTATNDCGADTVTESVTISNIVGIQELGTTLSRVQVVPNPNNGTFNLSLQALQSTSVSVKVINLQGQVVYSNSFNAAAGVATNQTVQLDGAATGLYIIQVQATDALFTEKLIVK